MPLYAVTEPHQVFAHLLEPFLWNQALWPLQLLTRFQHLFLALEERQPGMVKIVPQLDPLAVQILVVRSEA